MTLVIAYIGSKGAVVAGDMREIIFPVGEGKMADLEKELYSGRITNDGDLARRAEELGVRILVRDDKNKVGKRKDGILTGEVAKFEKGVVSRRRIYAAAGRYAIAEFSGDRIVSVTQKDGPAFIVFGNDIAKKIANGIIREHWKNGTLADAVRIIVLAMESAGQKTASVSRAFAVEQTTARPDLFAIVDRETKRA
ncbi:MAG: DUF2121 domain-containing protein [Methanomicrobiales archaeon]|nr:DUF2121 domain-containing protein [Methanomicrobiales archaeon]